MRQTANVTSLHWVELEKERSQEKTTNYYVHHYASKQHIKNVISNQQIGINSIFLSTDSSNGRDGVHRYGNDSDFEKEFYLYTRAGWSLLIRSVQGFCFTLNNLLIPDGWKNCIDSRLNFLNLKFFLRKIMSVKKFKPDFYFNFWKIFIFLKKNLEILDGKPIWNFKNALIKWNFQKTFRKKQK